MEYNLMFPSETVKWLVECARPAENGPGFLNQMRHQVLIYL